MERGADPAADPAANYDYRSDDVDRPALEADLDSLVDGEVRLDSYSRSLYATDASIYEETPVGVVFPTSTDDVAAVLSYCARRQIPVLPRGGGTSLAGQAVNRAVVLDFSRYMDRVARIDPDARTATLEPGVVLADLNAAAAEHDLQFAPDPAWAEYSTIGGAIGNNSTGAHSLQYGKTDAYVDSCQVVLADGTVTRFGEVSVETLRARADREAGLEGRIYAAVLELLEEDADAIEAAYPDLHRNVSGYNLDRLVHEYRGTTLPGGESGGEPGKVNLGRLLAGSEGTLAIVTEVTVSLVERPGAKTATLLCYADLLDAMADVAAILEHDPAAVESIDNVLLTLSRERPGFADVANRVPEGTEAALLVECFGEDRAAALERTMAVIEDRCSAEVSERITDGLTESAAWTSGERTGSAESTDGARPNSTTPVRAVDALLAVDEADRADFWRLRKSALPILLSETTDEKHVAFVEDLAVPPDRLPEFVSGMRELLGSFETSASYYAHAGPGVLHVRPLVNTKTLEGREALYEIADAATDLVIELEGAVSGEHGDGRARTIWSRKRYGEEVWTTFRSLKEAFDPDWLLNPGQVVGLPEDERPRRGHTVDPRESLRMGPAYEHDAGFEPTLNWANDNGMQGMVELCHGCGGCRGEQDHAGGVMCPTYRASREEITSTRGRANALRAAMSGELPAEELFSEEFRTEVLDLCISCKGCVMDCPSGVDMAKLKAEVRHERHQREGARWRDRLFVRIDTLSRLGSLTAPVSNWLADAPGSRWVLESLLGIDADPPLPRFADTTFTRQFAEHDRRVEEDEATRKALIYPDPITQYVEPELGMAAVRVLEAAGVHVAIPDGVGDSGRPAYSLGFLDRLERIAQDNVDALAPAVEAGWDVVVLEPSDAVMLQTDYADVPIEGPVDAVAEATFGPLEYLWTFGLHEELSLAGSPPSVTYHAHCHQKATGVDGHAPAVLSALEVEVDVLDSGCCGMAGTFGFEAEHASMSEAIARILYEQVRESDGAVVLAPGDSCRIQLGRRPEADEQPPTPIEYLDRWLA